MRASEARGLKKRLINKPTRTPHARKHPFARRGKGSVDMGTLIKPEALNPKP